VKCFIDTRPAVALTIIIGTRNGLTRLGPRSMWTAIWASSVVRPPTPVPAITATRAGSTPRSPASLMASSAAATPSNPARSMRRTSFGPTWASKSTPRVSHAKRTGSVDASNISMGAAVDRASMTRSSTSSTVRPAGHAMPMPVTAIFTCLRRR
jgi:hypothetical protein